MSRIKDIKIPLLVEVTFTSIDPEETTNRLFDKHVRSRLVQGTLKNLMAENADNLHTVETEIKTIKFKRYAPAKKRKAHK